MRYWLMKTEPSCYGIDDLARASEQRCAWWGVRNYQARNFMRDQMHVGDLAFFYHSSCPAPGIVGVVKVVQRAYPDATQFEVGGRWFDPKSTPENPRWLNVDIQLVHRTPFVSLAELRRHSALAHMRVLAPGNRLSITPVDPAEWRFIRETLMEKRP